MGHARQVPHQPAGKAAKMRLAKGYVSHAHSGRFELIRLYVRGGLIEPLYYILALLLPGGKLANMPACCIHSSSTS